MHERSWDSAKQLLRTATSWVFVGYSLSAADYEFKLLLKRAELSRSATPHLLLITGGRRAADNTERSYQKFLVPESAKFSKMASILKPKDIFRKSGHCELPSRDLAPEHNVLYDR
jgi:hypothetical protein